MLILLDECVPRPMSRAFTGHEVRTIQQMKWNGKKNGELLALMAANGFQILLTLDQNLRYQQNMTGSVVSVIVMVNVSNRLADLLAMVPKVEAMIQSIGPGLVVEVIA